MNSSSLTRGALAALILPMGFTSCGKQGTAEAEKQLMEQQKLADERRALELERLRLNQEKLEGENARVENERLRTENELRLAIGQLAEEQKKSEELSKTEKDDGAEDVNSGVPSTVVQAAPTVLQPETSLNSPYSFEPFYNELNGDDGSWYESPDYGYVWQPVVAINQGWAPYTDGGWVYSDYGWTWDSRESFGGICYHYGRWTRVPHHGWVWVPGRDWAPAWVSWRSSEDCIGWAPLPPEARWNSGIGIQTWSDGVYHVPPTSYCFVNISHFNSASCKSVLLPRDECERRYLASSNVTRIYENRHGDGRRGIFCGGPSFETLKAKLGDGLRQRELDFQTAGNGRKWAAQDSGKKQWAMPQWSLAKSLPEVARGNRPPKIKEKLEAASAVKAAPTPEIRLQQPAEVRRLMVQEASRALATMPDRRSGNSPNAQNRNDANREQNSNRLVAPRPATELVRPNASLPPVQQKLPVAAANPPASTVSPVQNRAPMVTQGNAVPLPSRPSNGNRQAAVPGQTGRPLPGAGTSGNVRRPDAELTVSPQNLRENNRSGAAQIVPSRPAVTQNNAVPQPAVNPQIPAQSVPPAPAYNNQASLVEVLRQRQEAAAQFEQQRRDSIQNEGRNGAGNRDGVENNNGPMSAQDLAARTQQEAQKANAAQSAQGLTGNASQQGINGTAPLQNEAVSSQNPLQQQLLARQAAEREHQARLRQNSEDATRLQQQQQQQLAADNASRQEQAQSQEENSRRRASQMQSENQARAAAESSRLLQQQQQAAAENSRQQAAAQAQQAAQASAAAHAAQQQAQAQAQAAAQSQAATRRSNEDAQRAASDQQRRAQEEQAKRR